MKAVSDVIAPLSGEVTEVNEAVSETPELINEDPYDAGWLVKVGSPTPAETDKLLDAAAYKRPARARRASEPGMTRYTSATDSDRERCSPTIGAASIEELFADIPEGVRLGRPLDLPDGKPEAEVYERLAALARAQRQRRERGHASSAPACTTTTCRRSSTRSPSARSS